MFLENSRPDRSSEILEQLNSQKNDVPLQIDKIYYEKKDINIDND